MDIHILREGTELGPFTEEVVQALLQQGSVTITDLSWRPGLDGWIPLANLLYATSPAGGTGATRPPPSEVASGASVAKTDEPASARQKAFLSYLGLPFSADLTRQAAAELVNEALENPREPARLATWNEERLKLHPDLFVAEVQAHKEGRTQRYLEVCHAQGAEYFTKVTKAHTQVLVGFLDVKYPRWEVEERTAAWNYLFPALAEKFPQLLRKEARGKFKYPEGPKVAAELVSRGPAIAKVKARRKSPFGAMTRGVCIGALILGAMWLAKNWAERRPRQPVAVPPVPAAIAPPAFAPDAASTPAAAPPSENSTVAAPEAAPSAGPATGSDFAPLPEAGAPAGSTASLFGPDPTPVPTHPSAVATRTSLLLTRPVEVQLAYGSIKLPPGTAVKLLQRDGNSLKVSYLSNTLTIPVTSTDLGLEGATGAAAPVESSPPTPAPRPPANAPKPEISQPDL